MPDTGGAVPAARPRDEVPVPFRSRATLETWLDEFRQLGYPVPGALRVVEQDGGEGANSGLVVVELANTPTSVYIQPIVQGSSRWVVSFEAR
jgi:hypothetical protein